jgi:MerR family transcriptional regulator, copper efflux regulator
LRTLRELLDEHGVSLQEVGFALRLRRDEEVASAVEGWFEAQPARPEHVPADDWLAFEQDKHQRLLAAEVRGGRDSNQLTETR